MRRTITLARRGLNRPTREPLVGVLVVAGDRVVARGFAGEHQSVSPIVAALEIARELASSATVYTNIEPCSTGIEQEVLVRRLIESRVARVVVGITKENDNAAGESILSRLRSARIQVETGVCRQACREINEKYFKHSETGLPFVTLKFAQSLDGRIATAAGASKWISGPEAQRFVHQLRSEHDAILVGIGTVMADDPQLTVRLVRGRNPLRVVVDSRLRIPVEARVLAEGAASGTLIVTSEDADERRAKELKKVRCEILRVAGAKDGPGIGFESLLREFGNRGIASVLVEGGKGIITSLLKARAVDRVVALIAPKIIGQGIEAVGDLGTTRLDDAIRFVSIKTNKLGSDIVFDGRLKLYGPEPRS